MVGVSPSSSAVPWERSVQPDPRQRLSLVGPASLGRALHAGGTGEAVLPRQFSRCSPITCRVRLSFAVSLVNGLRGGYDASALCVFYGAEPELEYRAPNAPGNTLELRGAADLATPAGSLNA
jgi:hypothetical protein